MPIIVINEREGSGTALTSGEALRSPSIQVVFKPPFGWPIVAVVEETSDSVVSPVLAMERPVVTVLARIFSLPKAAATVVAMSPGALSCPMAWMKPLVSLFRAGGLLEEIHTTSPLLPKLMFPLMSVSP